MARKQARSKASTARSKSSRRAPGEAKPKRKRSPPPTAAPPAVDKVKRASPTAPPAANKVKRASPAAKTDARGPDPGDRAAAAAMREHQRCPVVGFGASAGGLEAFTQVVEQLPARTGMAFVLVQHLDPTHESMLSELVARVSSLPVHEATDGMEVQPDHIYVIPPNSAMTIADGRLQIIPRDELRRPFLPINHFMRSLAESCQELAIGVLLSGTGTDGVLGLQAIKGSGGITFAQDERSARYPGMPRSAVFAGVVDFTLPPAGIARELVRIAGHQYIKRGADAEPEPVHEGEAAARDKLFSLLQVATDVDFNLYKPSTIRRRIERRMALRKATDLTQYVALLERDAQEVRDLYRDLLINVTSFFRDPETFDAMTRTVFPRLVGSRRSDAPIRMWVPGCATGEEAYSLAIALVEFLGDKALEVPVRIFATDVSDVAIEHARAGFYTEDIAIDVSPDRLRRFFVKRDRGYHVVKAIREMCIFARQNMMRDPAFSKLDLISCRNVLIYLVPGLQQRILSTFHFALNPGGILVLGSSESIGRAADLFMQVDRKHKIYVRRMVQVGRYADLAGSEQASWRGEARRKGGDIVPRGDIGDEADRIVLKSYAPAGVIINDSLQILRFRGQTAPYLEVPTGQASLSLHRMAREGLLSDLRSAVAEARRTGVTAMRVAAKAQHDKRVRPVEISVVPLRHSESSEPWYLVLFRETQPPPQAAAAVKEPPPNKRARGGASADERQRAELEQELATTKETLRAVMEEHESTIEDLRAANEEILSANEELQSTNEEMETAKEELQSSNEELTTVNDELQSRNLELTQSASDVINLLGAVNVAIVFVGRDLRIRRYTPLAERLFNLIASDIGRPIGDIRGNLEAPDFEQRVRAVIADNTPHESVVRDRGGNWYALAIRPYLNVDHKIDGAVVTLVDISAARRVEQQLGESQDALDKATLALGVAREEHRQVLNALPLALFVARDGHIGFANEAFARLLGTNARTLDGADADELIDERDRDAVRGEWARAMEGKPPRALVPARLVRGDGNGGRRVRLGSARLGDDDGGQLFVFALEAPPARDGNGGG